VVDSNTSNLLYTSTLLRRFEYQIYMARTASEALAITEVAVPSLIIIDQNLTDMDGNDLLQIFKHNPRISFVPVITLRKNSDLLGEKASKERGAAYCLNEPVMADQLYRAVQALVETHPRTNIRIRTLLPVQVHTNPLTGIEGACTLDLSEHGMFLRTTRPAPVNTRLVFQINLYGQIIRAEGVVLYSNRTAGTPYTEPGMGLEFVRITQEDQDFIRQFIRNEVMRGIIPGVA